MTTTYYRLHFKVWDVVTAFVAGVFDNFTYTVRHGLNKGMKRKGGLGFLPRLPWHHVSSEVSFMQSLPLEGKVVYDVGAFLGTMSLYFSTKARQVVAFEPVNYSRLRENLRLNQVRNVSVFELGIGSREETRELAYDGLMPGAASGDKAVREQILETSHHCRKTTIRVAPLDSLRDLPAPDLIKIDIEGMEMEALQGMRGILKSVHPDLYIELHGATRQQKERNARAVLEFLEENAYSMIFHVESGKTVSPIAELTIPTNGHLFCS